MFDRLERALAMGRRNGTGSAVLLMDLDSFKEVNDTLGHHNGDRLLQEVSQRLQGTLRETDTLARLGGDEFAVLLPVADKGSAESAAHRLLESLHTAIDVQGLSVAVDASVGIAVAPTDGNSAQELLQRADVAMYLAKERREGVAVYSAELDTYSPDRLTLLSELRNAIEDEQLDLYFQPKGDVASGRLVGFEALLRWQHPVRGLITPEVFIPLAEHTGLIRELTPWVLRRALAAAQQWDDQDRQLPVAINVSVRNIVDDNFPDVVAGLLEDSQFPPSLLVLEITESSLMSDPNAALAVLRRLKTLGIQLSIDDYGSGYSSLAYLQQLPVDELKIDRSFIRFVAEREKDRAIVRTTVELGHNLGLTVVAEGVEDAAVWDTLAGLHCDQLQGFYLSRPLPEAAVAGWIQAYQTRRPPSQSNPAAATRSAALAPVAPA